MNARHLFLALLALPMLLGADAPPPAAGPVKDIRLDIINAIPAEMLPATPEEWTSAHGVRINDWLQANIASRPAQPTLIFSDWSGAEKGRRVVHGSAGGRGILGFTLITIATFSESKEKEVKPSHGSQNRLTVEGEALYKFEVIERENAIPTARLTVTMNDPKIVKFEPGPPWTPPPVKPRPRPQ